VPQLTPLRVAVLADYAEEQWASMDLVADMLVAQLARAHAPEVEATLIRPSLPWRARLVSAGRRATGLDRIAGRLWDYPRLLRTLPPFDVYHLVDHSYSQLVHELPPARTAITCHDVDTFRSVIDPPSEPRSAAFRAMTRRILSGFRSAGHVACTTEATRGLVVARVGVDPSRTSVVHNGVDPSCTPSGDARADGAAAALLGPPGERTDLLHVGTTIPRKRIDALLRIVAALAPQSSPVRLVRVGGAFTAAQAALARDLGLGDTLVVPFVDRNVLAAIYRRAALLLLPSEREGFGLPLLEALACGVPAVASDIASLREVGGDAASYCPVGDVAAWASTVAALLAERRAVPDAWRARQARAAARSAEFSWAAYAAQMVRIYRALGQSGAAC
jgi:glycosyltransferase involved in cell wall biosynthesis